MQIRTGIAIGFGIGVGMIFGMSISEEKKCKAINNFRKYLIYALGGEERKSNPIPKNKVNYSNYKPNYEPKEDFDDLDEIVTFETRNKAETVLEDIRQIAFKYGTVSYKDVCDICTHPADYKMHRYGWTLDQVRRATIVESVRDLFDKEVRRYKITLSRPIYL